MHTMIKRSDLLNWNASAINSHCGEEISCMLLGGGNLLYERYFIDTNTLQNWEFNY